MNEREKLFRGLVSSGMKAAPANRKVKEQFGDGLRKTDYLKIDREIKQRELKEPEKFIPTKYREEVKAKKVWMTGKPEEMKGRIVYEKVTKPAFQSKYTYLMVFANLNIRTEEVQWKYIHLTSNTPKTKKELKTMLREVVLENEENMDKYEEWIPIIDSITLVMAWVAEGGEKPSEKGAQTERKQV